MSEIPEQVRRELEGSFPTEKGLLAAWTARWRNLDGQRMCDAWQEDQQRVLGAIEQYNYGDYI